MPGYPDEGEYDPGNCQQCGGPLVILGRLGDLLHMTCRNCGMQFSRLSERDY